MIKHVTEFQVVDHGLDHSQYFQGCGVSFTNFENVVTGCGDSFQEAIDDALESMSQLDSSIDFVELEQAIRDELGIKTVAWPDDVKASEQDPSEDSELYYYVSIRWN